jgi:undecaprenyl diphosphate synthase
MTAPQTAQRPNHIAIVMDGNGRWAGRRHRPRSFGHRAGQKAVRAAIEFCLRQGIPALTLFAFSSENWKRPAEEVGALMQLFLRALEKEVEELHQHGVRIDFIGDLAAFAPELQARMAESAVRTAANTALRLSIAVNYGGRWDIVQAARRAAAEAMAGRLDPDRLDEAALAPFFCLADLPAVDLFIRTGGEQRISNFLLWQAAYSEFYFTDVLWPDVDAEILQQAIDAFARRDRRFGQTPSQARRAG